MRVLVVGSRGSMGRRYCAILRYLKEEVLEADIGDMWWDWEFDRVILATPTDRHAKDLEVTALKGKPILCEKPIVKSSEELARLIPVLAQADIRMVSNWRFAINRALERVGEIAILGDMELEYNHYHSGRDGFFWDCCQLIQMAGRFKYDMAAPVFDAKVNGNPVTLDDIGRSYVIMISEWLHGDKGKLWSLTDAIKGARKVEWATRMATGSLAGEINFPEMGRFS